MLRIHTRVPVAEPARVTAELVRAIKVKGKPTYVALHINHPRELTPAARAACARMADAGIPLLGQSVLLAGVNDTPEVLGDLMRALVECRIKPYYLHHGDLAPGTAHLRTDIATGQDLMRALARAICRAYASRLTCSISPAATANRRSVRTISRRPDRTAPRISWSRISMGGGIAIRRQGRLDASRL